MTQIERERSDRGTESRSAVNRCWENHCRLLIYRVRLGGPQFGFGRKSIKRRAARDRGRSTWKISLGRACGARIIDACDRFATHCSISLRQGRNNWEKGRKTRSEKARWSFLSLSFPSAVCLCVYTFVDKSSAHCSFLEQEEMIARIFLILSFSY